MDKVTIYHKPTCTTCRQAVDILKTAVTRSKLSITITSRLRKPN